MEYFPSQACVFLIGETTLITDDYGSDDFS
jgi:hypothetical protein